MMARIKKIFDLSIKYSDEDRAWNDIEELFSNQERQIEILKGEINKIEIANNMRSPDNDFPFKSKTVPFILFYIDSYKIPRVDWGCKINTKINLCKLAQLGGLLLAVWPGNWRSDVFVIDPFMTLEILEDSK